MGIFNRFRADVTRVGAEVAAALGGVVGEADSDGISYPVRGTRGERTVCVTLNEMHGIYGVACELRPLQLESFRIEDDRSFFAQKGSPHVSERLQVSTMWDGEALWQL